MLTKEIKDLRYDLCYDEAESAATLVKYVLACMEEREFDAVETMIGSYLINNEKTLNRAMELSDVVRDEVEIVQKKKTKQAKSLKKGGKKKSPRRKEENSGDLRSRFPSASDYDE